MPVTQKITTVLWFDGDAEDAARLYTSIFRDSKILKTVRFGDAGPGPKGSVMIVHFQLAGQEFVALNGGPQFRFTEAVSLVVNCESQAEVDEMWARLSDGGEEGKCGWLKDRFGLSWQIVPTVLPQLVGDPDPVRANRVMQAMLRMRKIDVGRLQQAAAGR